MTSLLHEYCVYIVVVVVGFDEASFGGFKVLLRVEIVRVILHLKILCLLAKVNTFLQLVLHHIHLRDDALHSHQLVGHLAS